jgi:hypothetical protein
MTYRAELEAAQKRDVLTSLVLNKLSEEIIANR